METQIKSKGGGRRKLKEAASSALTMSPLSVKVFHPSPCGFRVSLVSESHWFQSLTGFGVSASGPRTHYTRGCVRVPGFGGWLVTRPRAGCLTLNPGSHGLSWQVSLAEWFRRLTGHMPAYRLPYPVPKSTRAVVALHASMTGFGQLGMNPGRHVCWHKSVFLWYIFT